MYSLYRALTLDGGLLGGLTPECALRIVDPVMGCEGRRRLALRMSDLGRLDRRECGPDGMPAHGKDWVGMVLWRWPKWLRPGSEERNEPLAAEKKNTGMRNFLEEIEKGGSVPCRKPEARLQVSLPDYAREFEIVC